MSAISPYVVCGGEEKIPRHRQTLVREFCTEKAEQLVCPAF
jgi:hypothetical protein